jgi:hypothetical protein
MKRIDACGSLSDAVTMISDAQIRISDRGQMARNVTVMDNRRVPCSIEKRCA